MVSQTFFAMGLSGSDCGTDRRCDLSTFWSAGESYGQSGVAAALLEESEAGGGEPGTGP
jgi:hypothetical protein